MSAFLRRLRDALAKILTLHDPGITFGHAVVGVVAITQSKEDFVTLFGAAVGAKVFVLAKWFGAYCTAVAAAGRSPIPAIDERKS